MNTNLIALVAKLSDEALRAQVKLLAARSRETTIELIVHLGELGARRLHRAEGPGSLFRYCTEILHLSEAAAFNRIRTARAARRFPVILDLLADGSVNMTTVRLLSPHLTADNHRALLAEASGMRRREVDKLVARLAPKPDEASSLRRVPQPRTSTVPATAAIGFEDPAAATTATVVAAAPVTTGAAAPLSRDAERPVVALSPGRYRLKVTIGDDAEDDLRRLQDLLRREIPSGDPAEIVARALRLLREDTEKKKCAATSKPRRSRGVTEGSRAVAAGVTRTLWTRDGAQCAFRAPDGRRCTERAYLERHHAGKPFALGGESTAENMALHCRAHNQYEAERIFPPPLEDRDQPDDWSRDP